MSIQTSFFSVPQLMVLALCCLPLGHRAVAQAMADNKGDTTLAAFGNGGTPAASVPVRSMRTAPEIAIQPSNIIRSYYIELPYNKTVSIIFNSPVRSVDLGSRSIIADKAADVENVLKVKATQLGFNETNFSVITADGKFYSFVASYNEAPAILALNLSGLPLEPSGGIFARKASPATEDTGGTLKSRSARQSATDVAEEPVPSSSVKTAVQRSEPAPGSAFALEARQDYVNGEDMRDGMIVFAGVRAAQSEVVANCEKILRRRRSVRHLGVEANLMEASVLGVYVKDNVFYYKVSLANRSNINYDVDYVRFFIADKGVAKLTSRQETEIRPFYIFHDEEKTVRGNTVVERVYAFQKFTIPDNKQLVVMAGEINGGRNLSFSINQSDITAADSIK